MSTPIHRGFRAAGGARASLACLVVRALWPMAVAAVFAPAAQASTDPCAGAPHCRVDGPLMSQVVKVNVTDTGGVTAYHGVRTTVRFTNVGSTPLALGYQNKSAQMSDDKGLAYRWSSQARGIGLVDRNSADPQFQLAPGETREASFENVLQYSVRRNVVGNVYDQNFTLVQLAVLANGQVRSSREYALGFPGLTATSGVGAGGGGTAALPPIGTPPAPGQATQATRTIEATGMPAAGVAGEACTGQPACQAQGPLVARVVGVNVTKSGNVTAYQTVRTTLRIQNVSSQPLILGYRVGSASLTDNQGLAYRWGHSGSSEARYVHGIGEVSRTGADPQFQLAPGESRDAGFDSIVQYNVRQTTPGNVFSLDLTLAQLAVVGNRQVRTEHEYALSFSNLTASTGLGGLASNVGGAADPGAGGAANAAQAVEAVGKVINLFKGLSK